MLGSESEPPRRSLAFRVFILVSIIVIFTYALWHFILPLFWRYEKLDMFYYYWVADFRGKVRQLVIVLENNGTEVLTVEDIWVEGVLVDPAYWKGYFGNTILPEYTRTVYVAPENLTFEISQDYNLTIVTSTRNLFSFLVRIDEASIKKENITIASVDFYHWPPPSFDVPRVQFEVKNLGRTDVIIKDVTLDGVSCEISEGPWILKSDGRVLLHTTYPWKSGPTYYMEIETLVRNTYNYVATAED